jgi:putative Holliday junction resolvase
MPKTTLVALDIGEKRIGVAVGDSEVSIAIPLDTIKVDGNELKVIANIVIEQEANTIIVGYPRNQSGEPTKQTEFVENFAKQLTNIVDNIVFQDESLTSVLAEEQLTASERPYSKADIDAQAAAIILQDYLEAHYGN